MANLKPLDYLNLGYIWLREYPSLRGTWTGMGDFSGIRVNYGYDRVPETTEKVFGGLVKLQDLNKFFPQSKDRPNILYLVSSALPYFPIRLTKMARKSGAKIVLNQNGVAYPGWYGDGYQKENRAMSYLHEVADYVFYQSQFCQLSAEKFLGARVIETNSEVLYNPVDTKVFKPLMNNDQVGGPINLLLSGSHWTRYRVFAALETLKIVHEANHNVFLTIAGRYCWQEDSRIAAQEVDDHAERLGVAGSVNYVGPYTQNEVVSLLNDCSILLHTKYNDPCPRLVIEAMACGLPVVYSATGGVAELVGDRAGVGVAAPLDWQQDHPPRPEELALCVLQVIDKLPVYAQDARQRAVSHFDVDQWISRHDEVFSELVPN